MEVGKRDGNERNGGEGEKDGGCRVGLRRERGMEEKEEGGWKVKRITQAF